MGFSLDANLYALPLENSLFMSNTSLLQSITRLSTGLRINSAADDPAGLAISNVLQSQVAGLNQSVSNAQAGISLVQTASGALGQTQTVLQNMLSLATEAATGTYSSSQVQAMQQQMNQYAGQITASANTLTFNTKSLLSGAAQNMQFQVGPNAGTTIGLSIGPMDAASLGIAGNAATLNPNGNGANIASLANAGAGLLGTTAGETYKLAATTVTTTTAGTYTNAGVASTAAAAAANQGGETLAGSGTFGTNGNYTVQVTGVNSAGTITGLRFSTAAGAPVWTNVAPSGTNTFTVNGGTLTFTPQAATAQVGDQFTLTVAGGTAGAATAGLNADHSSGALSGTYTGTNNLQYAVRASGIDSNNNVVDVQVSTDGGHTWGTAIQTTTGGYNPGGGVTTAGAAGTATAFAIGSGLTYTWTPGTFNPSNAATNGDAFTFNALAASQTVNFVQLSDSTLTAGGAAKYTGAAANIGQAQLVTAGQTSVAVGTGGQTVTANFTAEGLTGGLQNGSAQFTVATPQAAVVAGGNVIQNAIAPAGPNLATTASASAAITAIQNAINQVSQQQGQLGAVQNSLQDAVTQATTTSTNLSSANSTLVDANIAQETVNVAQQRIIQQADAAMLAQANQIPQLVLKLLGQ